MKSILAFGIAASMSLGATVSASAGVLDDVRQRGELVCGVNTQMVGFAAPNARAEWEGFNVDWCNAIAAAVGVPAKYRPVSGTERFIALATGEVDVLTREDTWTMSRDVGLGVTFATAYYYEGQTILTRASMGATKLEDLSGATACLIAGTAGAAGVTDLFASKGIPFEILTLKSIVEAGVAYSSGRCDFLYGDSGGMAAQRQIQDNPAEHVLFSERWGREPYGMSVRAGDDQWLKIVRAVFNAVVLAELEGITKENVDEKLAGATGEVATLLGRSGEIGVKLGLEPDFAYRAIKQVGNYAELFERNLAPIGLERGMNALYTNGGLLYPIPFR